MTQSTLYRVRTQLELPLPRPRSGAPERPTPTPTSFGRSATFWPNRRSMARDTERPGRDCAGKAFARASVGSSGSCGRTASLLPRGQVECLGPVFTTGRLSRTLPTRCGAPMRPASRHSKKARSRSSRQWIIALQSAWVSMRPDEPRVSRHSSQFGKASVSGSAPTPRRSPEASLFAMTMEASTSATTSRMSCASSALPRALRSFALRKGTAALSDSSGL